MALTYAYSLHAQGLLNQYISRLGEDRNNLLPNPITGKLIQNKLEDLFLPACEEMVCSNLRGGDRKSTRLNSSHKRSSRMPSSA